MALNHACLPIPAPALKQWYYNLLYVIVKEGVFGDPSAFSHEIPVT
jgi:hypothetical protein